MGFKVFIPFAKETIKLAETVWMKPPKTQPPAVDFTPVKSVDDLNRPVYHGTDYWNPGFDPNYPINKAITKSMRGPKGKVKIGSRKNRAFTEYARQQGLDPVQLGQLDMLGYSKGSKRLGLRPELPTNIRPTNHPAATGKPESLRPNKIGLNRGLFDNVDRELGSSPNKPQVMSPVDKSDKTKKWKTMRDIVFEHDTSSDTQKSLGLPDINKEVPWSDLSHVGTLYHRDYIIGGRKIFGRTRAIVDKGKLQRHAMLDKPHGGRTGKAGGETGEMPGNPKIMGTTMEGNDAWGVTKHFDKPPQHAVIDQVGPFTREVSVKGEIFDATGRPTVRWDSHKTKKYKKKILTKKEEPYNTPGTFTHETSETTFHRSPHGTEKTGLGGDGKAFHDNIPEDLYEKTVTRVKRPVLTEKTKYYVGKGDTQMELNKRNIGIVGGATSATAVASHEAHKRYHSRRKFDNSKVKGEI